MILFLIFVVTVNSKFIRPPPINVNSPPSGNGRYSGPSSIETFLRNTICISNTETLLNELCQDITSDYNLNDDIIKAYCTYIIDNCNNFDKSQSKYVTLCDMAKNTLDLISKKEQTETGVIIFACVAGGGIALCIIIAVIIGFIRHKIYNRRTNNVILNPYDNQDYNLYNSYNPPNTPMYGRNFF